MKLTILVDNNTIIDNYFFGEPGISFYIEDAGKKILFDAGYSDIFINNAQKMNINLLSLDYIAFSHGHLDHTWGIVPFIKLNTTSVFNKHKHNKVKLVAHQKAFLPKIIGNEEIGSLVSEEELAKHFELRLTNTPYWLTENLVFLGEIERINDFEANKPIGRIITDDYEEDDYLIDDSALVYKSSKGLVIITGCSHSGICNIIKAAQKVCDEEKIFDVIGGLHLLKPTEKQLNATLDFLKDVKPHQIHACHCTDLKSKLMLAKAVHLEEVGVGLTLEYN